MTTISTIIDTATVRLDDVAADAGSSRTLHPVSFSVGAGQIVGIAGGSGAGKTTLLETMAGVRQASNGQVTRSEPSAFVPQDDIIHRELPLRRTLLHAASLRLDGDVDQRSGAVDRVMRQLDLVEQADIVVGELSGGQRKRASLAAEMLTEPRLFFLDEPTSGLDPARSAELMDSFRDLASIGSTVVLTTHAPADLADCDQVVFVARGGHVVYVGTPTAALDFFGAESLAGVYRLLDDWSSDQTSIDSGPEMAVAATTAPGTPSRAFRQWAALVRRHTELIVGNRLTLAILLGSPVFIISMMAMLFPSGAFDEPDRISMAIQTLFWMGFNSFFFGLTYGLLQVIGEFEIIKRERRIGLSIGAYVASKLTVLVPLLGLVNGAQLVAMEWAGRLPNVSGPDRLAMFTSLQLLSTAAVTIGLHASAAVRNPAQATLALPMLCFPQVLFAGAVVPVSEMGWFSEAMSMTLAARWGFEPLGRILELAPSAAAQSSTAGYSDAFSGSPVVGWVMLATLTAFATCATIRTLSRRTSVGNRAKRYDR